MTTKADYKEEEWQALLKAPLAAGFYVITADAHGLDIITETVKLAKMVQRHPAPEAASELVDAIVTDLVAISVGKSDLTGATLFEPERDADRSALVELLKRAARIVGWEAPAEEAHAFKEWLLNAAMTTAKAAKEGSFLGVGGTRVTELEKKALEDLSDLLEVE